MIRQHWPSIPARWALILPTGLLVVASTGTGATLLINSTVRGNSAISLALGHGGLGGGIENTGTMQIHHTLVIDNIVSGAFPFGGGGDAGGIGNSGVMEISDSAISGHSAGRFGGGVGNFGGMTIVGSTIHGNSAGAGGGIENTGTLTISNSTVSGNTASRNTPGEGDGGGIDNTGLLTVTNSTVSGNSAGNGNSIFVYTGTLDIGSSILTTGAPGANIVSEFGTVISHGYNLSSDDGGGFLNGAGDQANTDPLLGPLQDNGGPTFTHELLSGSPALDTGDPNFTPPPLFDQRGPGYDRVVDGRIDVGSFERQP